VHYLRVVLRPIRTQVLPIVCSCFVSDSLPEIGITTPKNYPIEIIRFYCMWKMKMENFSSLLEERRQKLCVSDLLESVTVIVLRLLLIFPSGFCGKFYDCIILCSSAVHLPRTMDQLANPSEPSQRVGHPDVWPHKVQRAVNILPKQKLVWGFAFEWYAGDTELRSWRVGK